LLPGRLLLFELRDGAVLPGFLGRADEPGLRRLIELHDRHVGRRRRELDEALLDERPAGRGRRAFLAATQLLRQDYRASKDAPLKPAEVRRELFTAAAGRPEQRAAVVAEVARHLGASTGDVLGSLFADLPGERRLLEPERPVAPTELALRVNLANVQGLIYRATEVRLALEGNARRVIQHARTRGLICTVAHRHDRAGTASAVSEPLTVVRLSGPFSLFRRTLLYGRALAGLVPQLGWCRRYRLRAFCVLQQGEGTLELRTGDPLLPAPEPPRFDSRLEERFAREFERAAPDWELLREPEPFEAGGALVYPDFLLVNRHDPARRWYLEIVGFWTRDYLVKKLERYRAARLRNLLLAIDSERGCSEEELPADARLVPFRRRVRAEDVLAVIDPA